MKTLLVSLAICISFPLFSQSGWVWQNPKPTGNLIHDIQYVDKTHGWAVGESGTILYTDQLGNNWKIYESPTKNILYSLFMLSEEKGWAVGQNGTILHWDGSEWTEQHSGFDGLLKGVHFINSNTGWAVGQGEAVLKTTNGGEDWTIISSEGAEHYFGVQFLDENTGYLCGAAGNNGVIKYSSDGGSTWKVEIIPAHRMNDICMYDEGIGWAVGDGGAVFQKVLKESDWTVQMLDDPIDLQSVSVLNPNQAWIVGDQGTILHTNNAGAEWLVQSPPDFRDLYAICILDGESGYAAGDAGVLLHTWNAGGNWDLMGKYGPNGRLTGISFLYPELGMVCGTNGKVYTTLDLGNTWIYDSTFNNNFLMDIDIARHYTSYNRAIAVGASGTVLRRYWDPDLPDAKWSELDFGWNEDLWSVQVKGKTAWTAGQLGTVAHTSSSGNSWNLMHHSIKYHLYDVHFPTPNYGWAVGMSSKIIHTKDKGETWTEQENPVSTNYRAVWFCDMRTGWATGLQGEIIHTKDGGKTWEEQFSPTDQLLNDLYFTDCNNGWAVGVSGTILHTNNGGISWGIQESGTSNSLWSVEFADPLHGWICGDNGTVLYTEDGGGSTEYEIRRRSDISKVIMDFVETMDTLNYQDSQKKNIAETKKVTSLEVIIDHIVHQELSDLEITLSHAGITDTLVYRNAEGEDFVGLTLTDASQMPLDSGIASYSGRFKPFKPLDAFLEADPEGPWILSIYDAASGNTGSLEAWSIAFYSENEDVGTIIKPGISGGENGAVLYQNYPNPFKDQTYIKYYLPERTSVVIEVFNFLGQHVAFLLQDMQLPGTHQAIWNASGFNPGIYFVQLRAGKEVSTKKIVLIR